MRRWWTPVPYGSIVNDVARAAGVTDWTDVAPGDGQVTAAATLGLPLRRRHLVIPAHQARPGQLQGWTFEHGDLRAWAGTRPGGCVSLFDVIEHLVRSEADDVLDRLERCHPTVIVFTPLGFMRQDPTTHPETAEDPTMWHRCGFQPADFEARGYLTYVWPLYHPATGVGAILAVRVPPAVRAAADAAALSRYRRLAREASLLGAVGRWVRARARGALRGG